MKYLNIVTRTLLIPLMIIESTSCSFSFEHMYPKPHITSDTIYITKKLVHQCPPTIDLQRFHASELLFRYSAVRAQNLSLLRTTSTNSEWQGSPISARVLQQESLTSGPSWKMLWKSSSPHFWVIFLMHASRETSYAGAGSTAASAGFETTTVQARRSTAETMVDLAMFGREILLLLFFFNFCVVFRMLFGGYD